MTNHVAYPGCYCTDCVEGTPSARITGDKDRENPVEGAPHTPLGAALIYAQNRIRALEAENEALKAVRDDDGELLTIAWLDGSHRSTKAHRERIRELEAKNERLRNAMVVMDNTVRELTEALREMFEAVCGETGFAQAVRAESGIPYPWPALDRAEAMARAALEASDENR